MFVPTAFNASPGLIVGLNFYERRKKSLFAVYLSIIYGLNLRSGNFLSMICHRIRDRGLNSYPNTCCVIKINAKSCWEGLNLSMHICKNPSFVCSGVDFFLSIYHITRCKLSYATDTCYIFIYIYLYKVKCV